MGNVGTPYYFEWPFYSIGGVNDDGTVLGNADRYEPYSDTWTALDPIPIPVSDARAAFGFAPNQNLFGVFLFGGWDSDFARDTVQAYDVMFNQWNLFPFAPIPEGRLGSYVGTSYNNKIYLAGGWWATNPGTATSTTFEYDVFSDVWTTKAPMPHANGLGAYATLFDQFLFTFGGWDGDGYNGAAYRYDMIHDTWATIASLPIPVAGAVAGVVDGQIWIAGGGTDFGEVFAITQVYHPASDTYTVGPVLNQARMRFAGATIIGPGVSALVTGGDTGDLTATGASERSICPVPVELTAFEVK
jgi:hypothetical protein